MNMKPKLLPVLAVVILASCAAPRHAADEKYYLVATNIKLPYWQAAQAGLIHAGNQLSVKTEFAGPDTYDPAAQHNEFQRILKAKPTGILISPGDSKIMHPDIDEAIAQGIPVITIDSDSDASKRLLFIGTDNYKAGTMGAAVVAKELHGKGNVIVYTMPDQANLYQRLHGYQDAFVSQPGIKITQVVDIKGDPRIAFDKTKEILESGSGKVDAFVCLEAIACPEVADVVERQHVLHKVIVAMDTDPRTLEWIQKGAITATLGQKPFTMAFYGVKMLDDLHHSKVKMDTNWAQDAFSPIPAFVDTGVTLIDKKNVESYISASKSETKS